MATQKEKVDALTSELAEEKKATKRARTERDNYKAQVASKGDKVASFKGHVVLADAQQIEKGWRRKNETHGGEYVLRFEDGTTQVYPSKDQATATQRGNYYNKEDYLAHSTRVHVLILCASLPKDAPSKPSGRSSVVTSASTSIKTKTAK